MNNNENNKIINNNKKKNLFLLIKDTTGLTDELILVLTGCLIIYFHFIQKNNGLIKNIFVIAFVLALFDMFLKNAILLHIDNDYYKFLANNIITIVIVDFLVLFIQQDNNEINYMYFFNILIACLFYETIVFKLYNYNKICNSKLRSSTKIIFRLATIHILSNFLSGTKFDEKWFNFSISQLFNFILFDGLFNENFFEDNDT